MGGIPVSRKTWGVGLVLGQLLKPTPNPRQCHDVASSTTSSDRRHHHYHLFVTTEHHNETDSKMDTMGQVRYALKVVLRTLQ